jgi:uncharacterized protein YndB with AHSA1/START domain
MTPTPQATKVVDPTSVSVGVDVVAPIERAFDVFTNRIGTWWDDDKHILAAPLAEMIFEPRVGGHIIDRGTDGSECRWARILAYEPPHRVVFSWDITTQWQIETDPTKASDIEVTFTEISGGRTRVVLTHRHLDRHGEGWESMRDAVSSGWNLGGFARVIEGPIAAAVLGRTLPVISDDAMRERLQAARPYVVMVLRTTEAFVRPDVDPLVWEHGRRNMELVEAGLLSIVLPVGDGSGLAGIGVFPLTADEVRQIADADPGVRAGIFTYEIHPARGFPGSSLP